MLVNDFNFCEKTTLKAEESLSNRNIIIDNASPHLLYGLGKIIFSYRFETKTTSYLEARLRYICFVSDHVKITLCIKGANIRIHSCL